MPSQANRLLIISSFVLLSACATTNSKSQKDPLAQEQSKEHIKAIEKAERFLAEWGSAAASPIVFSPTNEKFKFDLSKTATDYFTNAKTDRSGGFSTQEQIITTLAAAQSSSADTYETSRFADALKNYQSQQEQQSDLIATYDEALENYTERNDEIRTLALENYEFCQSTVAEMIAAALANEDAASKESALKTAAAQRKQCLDEYISLTEIAPPTPSNPALNYPALSDKNVPAIEPLLKEKLANKASLLSAEDLKKNAVNNSGYTIPDHEAIKQAASNYWLQQIFSVLGDPKEQEGDMRFGVSMISVNPGWRTKNKYKSQIDIQANVTYQRAEKKYIYNLLQNEAISENERRLIAKSYAKFDRGILEIAKKAKLDISKTHSKDDFFIQSLTNYSKEERIDGPPMEIIALSPTTMSQNLDLNSINRRDFLISLSLSEALRAVGAEAQAEFFAEYAKRQNTSAASTSNENTVNVYSYGNNVVGVEVGPEFRANRIGKNAEKQYQKLQQQSFPVLFLARIRGSDTYGYQLRKTGPSDLVVLQPHYSFISTHRWLPNKKHWLDWVGINPKQASTSKLHEVTSILGDCWEEELSSALKAQCTELLSKLAGNKTFEAIPSSQPKTKPKPALTALYPRAVRLDEKSAGVFKPDTHDFIITGKNLKNLALDNNKLPIVTTLFPSEQEIKSIKLDGDLIHINVAISKDNKYPVAFIVKNGSDSLTTATLTNGHTEVAVNKLKTNKDQKKSTVIEVGGSKIILPEKVKDVPENITKIMQAFYSNDCKKMENKTFKIGTKTITIPEGYCDIPSVTKELFLSNAMK